MRIIKTFNKGRPRVSRTPLKFQESMAHGLSEGEPLRFHITMHRDNAPNDIHIFIRLISSDSVTFSRHGTFIPILDKVSSNHRRLDTQISSNACSFNTDWLRILQPGLFFTSLQPLNRDITGITGNSRSPAPATWMTNSPWDEPTSSTTTTLSFVLTDKIFFLFKLKHVAIRLSSYQIVYLHTLSFTPKLSNFDEFVCQIKHQHDISRISWGVELKISSFQIFTSLSCLNTNTFYITRNVNWFHHITLHGWHCKGIPTGKESYGTFPYFAVTSQSLFGNFDGFYQQTRNSIYELMQFMWLATSRQLWFLCGNFVKSRAHWKQRKNFDHGNVLSQRGQSSISAKPTGMKKKKDIPRLPESWKKLYRNFRLFHFHSYNNIAVIYQRLYV